MNVVQQGSVLNVKLTFKEPLPGLPAAFSVAKPARIALDFPNTTNGLGKSSQTYNEGDLKSANIVQAEDRTRVVLNLNKAMTYEATIDGNSLLLALSRAPRRGHAAGRALRQARQRSESGLNSIRDVTFRRGKDGEGGSPLTSPIPMPASTSAGGRESGGRLRQGDGPGSTAQAARCDRFRDPGADREYRSEGRTRA
jgi:hypothetical protein